MRKDILWVVLAGLIVGAVAVVLVGLGNPGNMGLCMACFERDIAGALGLHRPWAASWLRPEILGIMLGPIAEKELRVGLMASDGNFLPIITRPFSALFLLIAAASLLIPYLLSLRKKRRAAANQS